MSNFLLTFFLLSFLLFFYIQEEPQLLSIGDDISGDPESVLERVNLGKFACDFGNIVKGTHKTRSFKITNSGSLPISFDIFNFEKRKRKRKCII